MCPHHPPHPYRMIWSLPRAAALLIVAALSGLAAPVQAQSDAARDARPTVSQAPSDDASETAAPRRRPTPRSESRRARGIRPTVADSVVTPVSSRSEAVASEAAIARFERFERIEHTLRDSGPDWIGIPYRWGGTTRRGIDCSAFVQQFVRENLGIELTRTTATQRYEGVPVERDKLMPGDLVFFRRRGVRHVGVYLNGGEFIHASSSRGVTISELSSSYWDRHYWMARRIVTEPSARRPLPRLPGRGDSTGVRG